MKSNTSPLARLCEKQLGSQLVQELGYTIEHRSERGREEADDRATRMELRLSFWQDSSSLP